MSKEIFKDIPDYEGLYQASNLGRVKSLERFVKHPTGSLSINKGRILKPQLGNHGYNVVGLCKGGKPKTRTVSVLMAMAFLGHKPNGNTVIVDHKNNVRSDDRLENLQLITTRENVSKDQFRQNRSSKYIGVSWCKTNKKWKAQININGRLKYLGHYIDELDASNAYQKELGYF